MRVAYLQMECAFGRVEDNTDKAVAMIGAYEMDLIVLPELFSTGYLFTEFDELRQLAEEIPGGRTCRKLVEASRSRNCHIVAGIAEKSGGDYYNSAMLITPQGSVMPYRKAHLFSDEKRWFKPGDTGFRVYELDGVRIGIMICFDWIFPESARTLALRGADVICHPANLVLPYCQKAMTTRALENGVFAVTANRIGTEKKGGTALTFTGRSQIVDTRGEVLHQAGANEEAVGVVEINPLSARDKAMAQKNDLFADRRPALYYLET